MAPDSLFLVREAFEYLTRRCRNLSRVAQTTDGPDTVLSTSNGLTSIVLKEDAHTATLEVTRPEVFVGLRGYVDGSLALKYVVAPSRIPAQLDMLDAFLGQEKNNVVAKEVHGRVYVDNKNNVRTSEFHVALVSAATRNLGDIEWFLMRHVVREDSNGLHDAYTDMRMREGA